jgi:hypothetical protein
MFNSKNSLQPLQICGLQKLQNNLDPAGAAMINILTSAT